MSKTEALEKVIAELKKNRTRVLALAEYDAATAWSLLSCKIADLELALLLREPEGKKENE